MTCVADLSRSPRLKHSYVRILGLLNPRTPVITAIPAIFILLEHLHCKKMHNPSSILIHGHEDLCKVKSSVQGWMQEALSLYQVVLEY